MKMWGLRYLFLCGVLAVCLTSVNGFNEEERAKMKAFLLTYTMGCAKDYGVTQKDFEAAKEADTVEYYNPCFMSCAMKAVGMFDSKGMLDKEKTIMLATTLLSEEKQNALQIIEDCASINDQPVSDGDKGCERATLWIKCFNPRRGTLPGTPRRTTT